MNFLDTKIAFVVLSRGYKTKERYNDLILRNISLSEKIDKIFLKNFDFIIYHEGNISTEDQIFISKQTPNLNLLFKNVKKVEPKNAFDDSKNQINYTLCPPTNLSNSFPLGYKHMCHFWSIDFLEYLKNYKYIIRIDEDCILKNFNIKILEEMYRNNIKYVSPYFQEQDVKDVIVGLESLWNTFIKNNNFVPYKKFDEIRCPYTNFMIIDIEYFLNNDIILNFLNSVDKSHGIYSNRWGDLPIWGVILSTMVDPLLYKEEKSISYLHKSHHKIVN